MNSKFAIFGQERAGTTSLISALNKNDRIVHEPLSSLTGDLDHNPRYAKIIKDHKMNPEGLPKSKNIPYFNKFNNVSENFDRLWCFLDSVFDVFDGVKHVWCASSEEGNENFLSYCQAHQIKVIFQYRESTFYPSVSWQLANQVQIWQLGENKEHKNIVDSFNYKELEEPPIIRRTAWYKKYIPHYHSLLPPDSFISKYEDLYGLDTYEERLEKFNSIVDYLGIDIDENNVENFLSTDRRVFGKKAYDKISNYQKMFDKYGSEKIIL
tara:strand:+ start:54503 stop:55303 length:801 start_codon:yes stop_codon:yes gene_type:complete